jgi:hypothetical protein
MQRTVHTIIGCTLVTGICALGAGCADNNSTIYIRQFQAADVENGCVATNDPSGLTLGSGSLDRALSNGSYAGYLLVGNQLVRRGDPDQLRAETSRVQFYQADVEIFDFNGASIGAFSQPVSGFADPSTGAEPGYGLVYVTLLDAGSTSQLNLGNGGQTVVARVKVLGETLGGLEVETGLWDYPIFVCDNCFACDRPESCDDDIKPVCRLGQDSSVDCRCVGQGVCPPEIGSCG